jgi:TolA-binding protein
MGFSELSAAAEEMISRGEIARADPFLQELMTRFEHAEQAGEGVSLEPANWLAIQAKFALYQETAQRRHLQDAERLLTRFRERYPSSERMKDVIQRQGMLYAELGRTDEAIKTLNELLAGSLARQLSVSEEDRILHTLTLLYYQGETLAAGEPVFRRLIRQTRDEERRALATAALFEAHLQAKRFDEALELIPVLARESEARYRPRLNIAFFRASDLLSAQGRFTDASLMLTLAMTSPDMMAYFEGNRDRLRSQLNWIKETRPGSSRIGELQQQIDRIEANLQAMRNLPSLETDLLVRRARNFTQTGRIFEAFWLFYRLYQEFPRDDQFEFFAFASFANARDLGKHDIALDVANAYIRRFPEGRYAGDVLLGIILMQHERGEFEQFERVARQYLERFPEETNAEQVLSMYGAYLLDTGQTERLESEFTNLARRFPRSFYIDGTIYWRGMAALQKRDFEAAYDRFAEVARRFPRGLYGGESHFRMGVALFALERFVEARRALQKFQQDYPDDSSLDQSYYFLSQIALMAGDSDEAIVLMRAGLENVRTDDMRDVLTFELAALLQRLESFDAVLELLSDYLADHPDSADQAEAVLWKGKAFESKRMPSRMVDLYRDSIRELLTDVERTSVEGVIQRYASRVSSNKEMFANTVAFLEQLENDRVFLETLAPRPGELFNHFFENPGIDQRLYRQMRNTPELGSALLQDLGPLTALRERYAKELEALRGEDPVAFLSSLFESAVSEGQIVAAIRAGAGLASLGESKDLPRMPNEAEAEQLGPIALLYLAKTQMDAGEATLAKGFASQLLERYAMNDTAIDAHVMLAGLAEANDDLEEAHRQHQLISERFPASGESPIAILEEARLLVAMKRFDEARERYRYILQVPAWRGELYARAFYGIGRSFEAEGKLAEAHGFMERVFVAYHHFSEWAARAYLADAQILLAMGQREDARNTLREALNGRLQMAPNSVMEEMRQLLSTL